MSHKEELLRRIGTRDARVGIVGLGYVGLPLAVEFAEVGFHVVGIDVSEEKVALLNSGKSYVGDVPSERLAPLVKSGKFIASTNYRDLETVDAISICVPTPLRKTKDPDMSYVIQALEAVAEVAHEGLLVVLESTTYPGTTNELLEPKFRDAGFKIGEDAFIAFSPERIDPSNPTYGVRNTPKVVGGSTPACTEIAVALYSTAVDHVIPVSSPTSAEMVKLLENTFRAVNIGLVNEIALICDRLGINVWEVIEAAKTKPFGFMPFYPGPGLGGHCIPIDPFYLTWKAREYGVHTRFIELAGDINSAMPQWVLGKVADALNERGKAIQGCRILVLGIAYKKDVDDMRESPAVELMELLSAKGARVEYSDPHVPVFPKLRKHRFALESVPLTAETLGRYDLVLLATDHTAFDYALIQRHAPVVVDTRGVYLDPAPNIVKA